MKQTNPELGAIATDRGQAGTAGAVERALMRIYSEVTFKLDYMCTEGLPSRFSTLDSAFLACNEAVGISGMHKFLQYRRWLKHELSGFVQERMAGVRLSFFNADYLVEMTREHLAGRKNFNREINAVATLGAVERLILRTPPEGS